MPTGIAPWDGDGHFRAMFHTKSLRSAKTSKRSDATRWCPYSTEIDEDARRRDFTMNAIYATSRRHGDRSTGRPGRSESPACTICRRSGPSAFARIICASCGFSGFTPGMATLRSGLDAEGLAAVAEACGGSAEPVERTDRRRDRSSYLSAPDPAPAVAAMRSAGILQVILPGD